jgi:putative transposase
MSLSTPPKGHRFPMSIISQAVWRYHRFNDSYRDIKEDQLIRGILVSHEAVRGWCIKFSKDFKEVIKKREQTPEDKWNTDKLKSYFKPIRYMMPNADHRAHKGLNNRVENDHQPTRRKEKCLIKFKSPQGLKNTISLMEKVRNIFSVDVGRYTNSAQDQRDGFKKAQEIWDEAAQVILYA